MRIPLAAEILLSASLASCYNPNIIHTESDVTFGKVRQDRLMIDDPQDRLKRDILESNGLKGKELESVLRSCEGENVNANRNENFHAASLSLYFTAGEDQYEITVYDDNNDGSPDRTLDGKRKMPPHVRYVGVKLFREK